MLESDAPRSGGLPSAKRPGLFQRIGYDQDLEAEALAHLEEMELDASRRAFSRLVRGLDLSGGAGDAATARQLLRDLLHEVNRRLHRTAGQQWLCQRNRVDLVERFAAESSGTDVREEFRGALRHLLKPFRAREPACHPLVRRARALIERSYERRISLSTVARDLGVSPNYLSRLFRRETGMTLTSYTQRVRLGHAVRLLAEESRSIAEIGYRVGYRTYRDFHRNFVKYQCASPMEVRRRLIRRPS